MEFPDKKGTGDLALVMSGGGARAAYQVGCLRYVLKQHPKFQPSILTGVSAGAINTAHLASFPGSPADAVESLAELWCKLNIEDVFHTGLFALGRRAAYWGSRLAFGGHHIFPHMRGMVDTRPLRSLLMRVLNAPDGRLAGIDSKLAQGQLKAVALTTSSYSTGRSVTWVQGSGVGSWRRAHRESQACKLHVDHIMASSALPLLFPAIQVQGRWYGDGGIRLSAPLSPAVRLGASRILAVSTRHRSGDEAVDRCYIDAYPPPAQVAGNLLNAVFLDLLEADSLRMQRINQLLEHIPGNRLDDLRPVQLVVLRPSQDLGTLANDFEVRLPGALRFLTRGLGTRETRSNDLLSLLMFQPDYLAALVELGEKDAAQRGPEIEDLLQD